MFSFRQRGASAPDPVVEELRLRLQSLDNHCLSGLQHGLDAMTNGDFTHSVEPRTTPIDAQSTDPAINEIVALFNSMLGRAQASLESYNALREDLRSVLGDQSCLDDLRGRLHSLNGNCLTNLEAGLAGMATGDFTHEVIPVTTPIETPAGQHPGEFAELFNEMLGKAQASLAGYNTVREDIRGALGDQSCLDQLRVRLNSLNSHCLTNLEAGLAGITQGDLTLEVIPVTTAIETAEGLEPGEFAVLFNEMLGKAQASLTSYNVMREDLREALGDQSCLDQLRTRLTSLNENCLTNLQVGLELMSQRGDLTKEVIPVTTPVETEPGRNAGVLAEIFNGMLGRAQTSLEAYNVMREDLKATSEVLATVAGGDLTVNVAAKSEDDVLGNSVVGMTGQLSELVGQVALLANQLSEASVEMARSSEEAGRAIGEIANAVSDVANGAERQVRTVESARRMTEEVAGATRDSAASAEEATEAAKQATVVAQEGAAAVEQATEAMVGVRESSGQVTGAMDDLARKSEQIGGIVDTITNIAEQTNLLALNAAIEAARAGDQGRGFAVVADEVRKLAEESQRAAASIGSLVQEIQRETKRATEAVQAGAARTDEGASTVEQARESFLRIGQSVEDMTDRVTRIASAVQQIADSSNQMQSDMADVASVAEQSSASAQQVSASTQETTASAQEIAASAQDLARRAESLEEIVGRFQLAGV